MVVTASRQVADYAVTYVESSVLGLFLASLGLSTAVAGTTMFSSDDVADGPSVRTARSLRFWTLYLGLFGLIGAPLTLLQLAAPVPVTVALGSAAILSHVLSRFFHETSAEIGVAHLAGAEARVLLPVGCGSGKIVVTTLADRVELPARCEGDHAIARGCRVVVAAIIDGVALVVPLDRI